MPEIGPVEIVLLAISVPIAIIVYTYIVTKQRPPLPDAEILGEYMWILDGVQPSGVIQGLTCVADHVATDPMLFYRIAQKERIDSELALQILQKFHFYAVRESQPRAFFGGVTPSLTLILASANCAPGSDCARFAGQKQVLPFRWRSNIIVDGIGVSYGPVGRWDDVIIAFPESKTTREIYQLDGNVLSALGSVAEIAALVRPAALNIDRLVAKDKTIADLQSAHLEALKELSDERDRRAMAEHIAARKPLEEVLPAGEMERPSNTLLYLVLAAAGFFLLGPMIYQNAPQVGSATNGGILGALLLAGGFYFYQRYRGRRSLALPL